MKLTLRISVPPAAMLPASRRFRLTCRVSKSKEHFLILSGFDLDLLTSSARSVLTWIERNELMWNKNNELHSHLA